MEIICEFIELLWYEIFYNPLVGRFKSASNYSTFFWLPLITSTKPPPFPPSSQLVPCRLVASMSN